MCLGCARDDSVFESRPAQIDEESTAAQSYWHCGSVEHSVDAEVIPGIPGFTGMTLNFLLLMAGKCESPLNSAGYTLAARTPGSHRVTDEFEWPTRKQTSGKPHYDNHDVRTSEGVLSTFAYDPTGALIGGEFFAELTAPNPTDKIKR